jgi:hypothetical protein
VNGEAAQAIHGPIPFLEEPSIVTPQATGTARRRRRDFRHPANRAMRVALAACVALALPAAFAQDAGRMDEDRAAKAFATQPAYSPYAGRSYPTRPYFGHTHLHTSFSMDAGAFGARLTPRDAYRFARGEEVDSSTGQPVRLSRPLDFLVVADHSDGFGFFPLPMSGDPELLATPQGRKWYDQIRGGQGAAAAVANLGSRESRAARRMPPCARGVAIREGR